MRIDSILRETFLFYVISFAVLLATLLQLSMPDARFQTYILVLAVILIGLPHGALDIIVAQRMRFLNNKRHWLIFHLLYISIAGFVVFLWLSFPVSALFIFLLYSAYHFSGDWIERSHLGRLMLGLAILSLPLWLHAETVTEIYMNISAPGAQNIALYQSALAPFWLLVLAATIGWSLYSGKYSTALELFLVGLLTVYLSPLLFFLIYFCTLHSARHFLRIWRASHDRGKAVRMAAIYTGATVMLAMPLALLWAPDMYIHDRLQRLLFVGLAALTVPHMCLITLAEKKRHV